ncbi:MAG: MATE family efflux transporter [Pseudoramibacter sp.]
MKSKTLKAGGLDMVSGSIWNKLPLFALPVAATSILEQLFNAADLAVVGRFTGKLGTVCMAAVGANTPIVSLIVSLFVGVALGANVVIAHAIGGGREDRVHVAVGTSVLFAVLAGCAVTVVGEIFAPLILKSMDVPEKVLPFAVVYLRIYLAGLPVIFLYNFEAAIFRAVGKTQIPLLALLLSGGLNVVLNLCFVIGLHRTVDGVATATVISNLISSAFLLWRLFREDTAIHLERQQIRVNGAILKKILRIGVPAGVQSAVFSVANIVIQSSVNSLGAAAMAGSSASLNLEALTFWIFNAFGQAATTFVGQNDGAGRPERCRRVLSLTLIESFILCGAMMGTVWYFSNSLLGLFNTHADVIHYGHIKLGMLYSGYFFAIVYEVVSGYLRGFGISLTPAILTTIGVCGVRLLWIFLYFPTHHTFRQLMLAYPLSFIVTAVLMCAALLMIRPAHRRETA